MSEPSEERPGFFVTLEGIDGVGKSSMIPAIRERYPSGVYSAEPSDLKTGPWVREAISDTVDQPLRDFHLYMADRAAHIDATIRPALEDGRLVVSDRYTDSTRAYQPIALRSEIEAPEVYVEGVMRPWAIEPDLTIYLDLPAHEAAQRIAGDDQYEVEAFLHDVRSRYLELAQKKNRIIPVDTRGMSVEEVQDRVCSILSDHYE